MNREYISKEKLKVVNDVRLLDSALDAIGKYFLANEFNLVKEDKRKVVEVYKLLNLIKLKEEEKIKRKEVNNA